MKKVFNMRKFNRNVGLILLLVAFFHKIVLENSDENLRRYFKTYGGSYNYSKNDLNLLLNNIFTQYEKELEKYLLTIKLQTNEVTRTSVM